jgi:hypothetical protein
VTSPRTKGDLFQHLRGEYDAGCLTLYMAAGPGYDPTYYRALLKDVERDLAVDMDERHRIRLGVEIRRVDQFLDDVRPPGLPLAVFSCVPDGVFNARRLKEDVHTEGFFDTRFHLGHLDEQLRRHPPALVVVTEKDKARLFAVVLDDVHELDEIEGEKISDTKRQGRDSSRRHVKEQERQNIKRVIDRLMHTGIHGLGLEALYVAGPVAARSQFIDLLPQPLRKSLRGELEVQVRIDSDELADEIRALT